MQGLCKFYRTVLPYWSGNTPPPPFPLQPDRLTRSFERSKIALTLFSFTLGHYSLIFFYVMLFQVIHFHPGKESKLLQYKNSRINIAICNIGNNTLINSLDNNLNHCLSEVQQSNTQCLKSTIDGKANQGCLDLVLTRSGLFWRIQIPYSLIPPI